MHNGEIVVTQPDHGFCAFYVMHKHRAQMRDEETMPRAWEAANAKARELGWIVETGRGGLASSNDKTLLRPPVQ